MLTCFHLPAGVDIDSFSVAWQSFVRHMQALALIEGSGPIGRRQRDTRLDTDNERDHEYFVLMHFRDRAQADAAWAHIVPRPHPTDALHQELIAKVQNPIFICWQDIETRDGQNWIGEHRIGPCRTGR